MKIQVNKELAMTIGKGAMKYGKLIVVEGIKSIAAQGAMKVVNTAFDEGIGAVKDMKFDDLVGINDKKTKKKLFTKTKKETKVEPEVVKRETILDLNDDVLDEVVDGALDKYEE